MIHHLKHHDVWLVGQTKPPKGLRINRTGGPYANSFNNIDWVDYQEIITQLLQDNEKMRELLQEVSDCRGTMADEDSLNAVDEYIKSLSK